MSLLTREALCMMLGIESKIPLTPLQMADNLNVTFFPFERSAQSEEVISYINELHKALLELKVNIVPYEESLIRISIAKIVKRFFIILYTNVLFGIENALFGSSSRLFVNWTVLKNLLIRKRIKPNISIITVDQGVDGKLPIDFSSSFTRTLVVTIVDRPKHITKDSEFHEHFDTAMNMFAKYMTNVVIAVDAHTWTLYNFNASHPTFARNGNFKEDLLQAFISKAAAPMRPEKLSAFVIKRNTWDVTSEEFAGLLQDLKAGGKEMERIGLYPKGRKIDDLPFRNGYYRWIGKIHLDQRSGMSYGFLAWQLRSTLQTLKLLSDAPEDIKLLLQEEGVAKGIDGNLYIRIHLETHGDFYMQVPEVRVLTLRSGCDKTNINVKTDLLLMGIENGQMYLETPKGTKIASDYRPSFDTKVILAHALGNVIGASILDAFKTSLGFVTMVAEKGVALSHWHGYINANSIPSGWHVHGAENPHVACSTPQSAIYAIEGKLEGIALALSSDSEYKGDIHIEPHHGTNINFPSLVELAAYFGSGHDIVSLGNKHFIKR